MTKLRADEWGASAHDEPHHDTVFPIDQRFHSETQFKAKTDQK